MFSSEQILLLRHIVAEETTEALYRQRNHRSIVIYGLPEGDQKHQVNCVLANVNISPEYVCIRNRLGNPTLGKNRPLRVDLREGIPMPSLRDLARKLSNDATLSSFHVRLLETPRKRKEGFEARQARRHASEQVPAAPIVTFAVAAQVLEFSSVTSIDFYNPPVITLSSSSNSVADMSVPVVLSSPSTSNASPLELANPDPCFDCMDEPDLNPYQVGNWLYHATHIVNCIHVDGRRNAGAMYKYFNLLPENHKALVSDEVFRLSNFRLNVVSRSIWQ